MTSGIVALLLAGGGAVGAAPAPRPAANSHAAEPSTSPQPLRVALPGLLIVTVDLPILKLDLLGGKHDVAGTQAPTAPTPAAPSPSDLPTAAGARPAPPRADPASTTPSRTKARTERADRLPRRVVGAGPTRAPQDLRATATGAPAPAPGTAAPAPGTAAPTPGAAAPRPVPPRRPAEAFHRMVRTGLPVLLLAGVVGMCGLGTVVVVRSAGRGPRRARRAS